MLPPATVLAEAAPVYFATGLDPVVVAHAYQPSVPALTPVAEAGFDEPVAGPAHEAHVDEAAADVEAFAELASAAHGNHGFAAPVLGSDGLTLEASGPLAHSVVLGVSLTLTVMVTVDGLSQAEQ